MHEWDVTLHVSLSTFDFRPLSSFLTMKSLRFSKRSKSPKVEDKDGDTFRADESLSNKAKENSSPPFKNNNDEPEQQLMPVHEDHAVDVEQQQQSVEQTEAFMSAALSELGEEEDDPVVLMRHLRNARKKMKKGVSQVKSSTRKAVKGTQKQLKKGTHKVYKRTQQALGQSTISASKRVDDQQLLELDRDIEAAEVPVEPNHNEASRLLPQAETAANASPTPVGRKLWKKTRLHLDEIVLSQQNKSLFVSDQNKTSSEEAKHKLRREFEFSMVHVLLFIAIYLCFAVVAYSFIFEHWSIIDSLYFAVVTSTTIGYGDIVPTSDASRIFTAVYALCGVACLGVALGILGSNLLDGQEKAFQHAQQLSQYRAMSLFEASSSSTSSRPETPVTDSGIIQEGTRWYQSPIAKVLPLFTVILLGSLAITATSQYTVAETLYFCIVTATTIGYGDFHPQAESTRLLSVFFILVAVGAMGQWMSLAAGYIIKVRQASFQKAFESHELTLKELEAMDTDGDGKVSCLEFMEFMLVAMDKCDKSDIDKLKLQFSRLDVDGTGVLEKEDLVIVAKRKLKNPKRKLKLAEYKQKLLNASMNPSS